GGRNIFTLRALPSCFSALSVLIFAFSFLRSQIVNRAMLFFILLSPAFLFFGRSGIHEMPFVFFQLVFAVGILRWGEKQDNLSVNLLLVGLFGMMMLKETFVLTLSSFAVGFLFLGRKEIARQFSVSTFKNSWQPRSSILLVALLIFFVTFFSGFMRNPSGLTDFVRAFLPWMKTGVGESGHNKEFLYWLKVISEAEPLVFLGVIMAFVGLFMRDSALRLMSAFSLAQLLIYSLIPYKTVWCVLSLVWGFYFVLAMFLEKFWQRWTRLRWVYLVGIFLLLPLQLRSDYLSVYREPIAMTHPYVYVNSTYEFKNFYTLLNKIFAEQPALILETKQIGTKEQWPWPWFLYGQPQVHYDLCGRTQHPHALF
ncbi:MAG TPA: hypothetical protein VN132_14060, partial [Bdellovibrio sp.]|nr:hypothetical protein [Bdellovibrio sp.]